MRAFQHCKSCLRRLSKQSKGRHRPHQIHNNQHREFHDIQTVKVSLLSSRHPMNRDRIHNINHRLHSTSGKGKPRPNEILMRSVSQDCSKPLKKLTFGEMLTQTTTGSHIKVIDAEQLLIQSAEFSRHELIPRIARQIMTLRNLPYGVSESESIGDVLNDYMTTYEDLKALPKIKTMAEVDRCCELAKFFLLKHILTIPKVSYGLLQKATQPNTTFVVGSCPYLNDFIDRFAAQRISIRVLLGHFVSMFAEITTHKKDIHGLFEGDCNIMKYVENAIIDSTADCMLNFGNNGTRSMPRVRIYDQRRQNDMDFTYIPEHLHHMVFELLKNSMRAVMEKRVSSNLNDELEDEIKIIVVNNASDGSISIKISDAGGGIARENKEKIWLYSYTTAYDVSNVELSQTEKMKKQMEALGGVIESAEREWLGSKDDATIDVDRAVLGAVKYTPMFGLGYGLPIVKVYANYFGGSCKIQSIYGYGTDAYLDLNNLNNSNVRVI